MDATTYPELDEETSVPRNRVLPILCGFAPPELSVRAQLFGRAHERSEVIHNGDGSWGSGFVHDASSARWRALFARPEDFVDRGTVRDTARRISGYTQALDVIETPVYRNRLADGVEWLLAQQFPDGSFPWWVSRTGMPDTDHLYYVTGYAVVGLLDAYRHLPDPRVLNAVARAATWTAKGAVSPNSNYNSFACWILASCDQHHPQADWLMAAVRFTLQGVLPRQLANGGWAGHNSWVYYQGIIVSGLALLLAVPPAYHSDREPLECCFRKAINNLLARQREDGALLATFDPQERAEAKSRRIGYERAAEFIADPHALLGLLWASDRAGYNVEAAIKGLIQAYATRMLAEGPESDSDARGIDVMAPGCDWRWLTRGNAAGQKLT